MFFPRITMTATALLGMALPFVVAPTVNAARFGAVGANFSLVARPPLESSIGNAVPGEMYKLFTQEGDYLGLAAAQFSASERFVDLTTWTGGDSAGGLLPIVDYQGHVGFDPLGPPAFDLLTPQTRMQMLAIGDSIFMSTGSHVFLRGGDGPFGQDVHLQASFDPTPPPPPICLDMLGLTDPCVPEPKSSALWAMGAACLVWVRHRCRRRRLCEGHFRVAGVFDDSRTNGN